MQTTNKDVVIIGAARTPQGKIMGSLSSLSAVELGTTALAKALAAAGVAPEYIEAVIFGQVVQAGAGQNPAKQTASAAGIPLTTPAVTVNSVCLSGLRAVMDAARLIRAGEVQVAVAGGQESMSRAPFLLPDFRSGRVFGATGVLDAVERDALTDAQSGESMGVLTEGSNADFELTREQQDEIAAASHQRAHAAASAGLFEAEIAPVQVQGRRGQVTEVTADEGVREGTTVEILAQLRPAFDKDGTITAGNASPLSDGAAALMLSTREFAEENGIKPLATVLAWANTAGPENVLHYQPSRAIAAALKKAGLTAADLDHVEINEAFAAVSAVSIRELGLEAEKVNPHGGAIALGHPVGASGARLVVHAAHTLNQTPEATYAAVALCGGGGQGDALILGKV
ncbi:MAG: acetyl-CoA C-acyltransferase [Rothia sp. (in: high G+C Gram-positive bacteria)]|uniref:acetyl-CoA C-acyltransferase n=1 Tax=Rothia sp. (in: high G+C Gram-positive bacteria) TaxID=1885016 RepID=UPI0026FE3C94|nr:acetyl-CoA C-acyltransferase [Rothia sp. (in: high G+C Gram-positive bacteria)]